MKTMRWIFAVLALAGTLSCSYQSIQASAKKGQVIVTAQTATKSGHRVVYPKTQAGRTAAARGALFRAPLTRDISAGAINGITYTVTDLTATGTPAQTGSIDPNNPYVDLVLNGGDNYRIVVSVDINTTAPGVKAGVLQYGDQQDFTVATDYDTYVNLTIHPTLMPVFFNQVTGTTIKDYLPPHAGISLTPVTPVLNTSKPMTASSSDCFFYGPDGSAYYFNASAEALFQWTDLTVALATGGTPFVDLSTTAFAAPVTGGAAFSAVYAICPDPVNIGIFWAVAAAAGHYYVFSVDTTQGGQPAAIPGEDMTANGDIATVTGDTPTAVVPTGIAEDPYGDTYVSYYATGGSTGTGVYSGVLEYYGGSLYSEVPATPQAFTGSTTSIYTDVTFEHGNLWVLAAPNTTLPGATARTGTADLLTYDDYLNPVTATWTSPVTQPYTSAASFSLAAPTTLVVPNYFAGPIQGSLLYLSQLDYKSPGTEAITSINLESGAVANCP